MDTGTVEHAYLGISGATISDQLAEALNLGIDQGVIVQEVPEGGPAAEAGIEAGDTPVTVGGQQVLTGGDVITEVNGEEVGSMEDLIAMINESKVGDEIELTVDCATARPGQSRFRSAPARTTRPASRQQSRTGSSSRPDFGQ